MRRKQLRRFNIAGQVRELTFSCHQRLPLLNVERRYRLLARALDAATEKCGVRLIGFVFMPEHVHLLVLPERAESEISRMLAATKQPVSLAVRRDMQAADDPWLDRLTVQERPGKRCFRFWQEGGGYDRNMFNPNAVLQALDYIHGNPVRRGLCASPGDWKWSSWHHYFGGSADPDLPRVDGLPPL